MSIVQKSIDEIKSAEGLSKKELETIEKFQDEDISDCPELTDNQLSKLRPLYEEHPQWYKVVVSKTPIQIRIDNDILEVLKKEGKGYQTKINSILREYLFG